jgi:hypothetical protein
MTTRSAIIRKKSKVACDGSVTISFKKIDVGKDMVGSPYGHALPEPVHSIGGLVSFYHFDYMTPGLIAKRMALEEAERKRLKKLAKLKQKKKDVFKKKKDKKKKKDVSDN